MSRDHVTRPTVRVTHDEGGAPLTPFELDLFEAQDVVITDTLQDLVGPSDAAPPIPGASADERHEQRLSTVLA